MQWQKFKWQINLKNQAAHLLSNKNISSYLDEEAVRFLHFRSLCLSLFQFLFFSYFIHFSLHSLIEYNLNVHSLTAFFHIIIYVSFILVFSLFCTLNRDEKLKKKNRAEDEMAVYFSPIHSDCNTKNKFVCMCMLVCTIARYVCSWLYCMFQENGSNAMVEGWGT